MSRSIGHLSPSLRVGVPPPFLSNRSALLDCIRTIAIVSVLIFHVAKFYTPEELDAIGLLMRKYGKFGVDIFFPLSGYLITRYLIQNSGQGAVRVFFQRRVFRILPIYLVAVTIYLFAGTFMGTDDRLDLIWIPYLFLTGWFIFLLDISVVPYTITWSLSVEEFSYILLGLFSWFSRKNLPFFLLVLAIGSTLLRVYLSDPIVKGFDTFPPARLDSIAFGGLVAIYLTRKNSFAVLLGTLGLATVAFGLIWIKPGLWDPLKYSIIAFGTCLAIVVFESWLRGMEARSLRVVASIGFYSYYIYLFHLFNIHFLALLWDSITPGSLPPFWGFVVISLVLTHIQAIVSFRFFEGPMIAFGRRLEVKKDKSGFPI